ncbi:hypothetical protein EV182_002011, partial [Spiromyces aspiralis]
MPMGFNLTYIEPYWDSYFPNKALDVKDKELESIISGFVQYLDANPNAFILDSQTSALFKYPMLKQDQPIPQFFELLHDRPEFILNCLGLALCTEIQKRRGCTPESVLGYGKLRPKLLFHEPITHMKSLKSSMIGKLITIRGTVIRISPVRPLLVNATFECVKCKQTQTIPMVDGKYTTPSRCYRSNCRSKIFELSRNEDLDTKTIDWQQIRLQEKINDDRSDSGRVPKTIDAELTYDLVDTVVPGDVVNLTGVVKVAQSNEGKGRNMTNSMYILYIDANSINKASGDSSGSDGQQQQQVDGFDAAHAESMSKDDIHFTQKELQFVRTLFREPDIFKLLVHSLCPGIFGHEMVKAGLLLALFGGRNRALDTMGSDHGRVGSIRSDPHVLVVGDPGLGKSQMLMAAVNVAPRGVYVCGSSGTSSSGLTVTLVKESGSGDFALEAGALVLSDQGCCGIDEFDKITSDHSALLEAMEQQSVSIAKAGIVCSLPARCSVIAAANPVGGHYNKAKSVSENLKMDSALLSRFDLIFILLDKSDADMDLYLSNHVMAFTDSRFNCVHPDRNLAEGLSNDPMGSGGQEQSFAQRLAKKPGEELDPIPLALLRKYISYCRKYVQPRLTKEAAEIIQTFYLNLRRKHRRIDSTPITTRQIEAMVRMAEARARAELRDQVTERDAADIVELMQFSLYQTYEDEAGNLDFERSQMGTGSSKRQHVKKFVSYLQRVSEEMGEKIYTYQQLYDIALEIKLQVNNFGEFVDILNNQGYLIKRGPKKYQ